MTLLLLWSVGNYGYLVSFYSHSSICWRNRKKRMKKTIVIEDFETTPQWVKIIFQRESLLEKRWLGYVRWNLLACLSIFPPIGKSGIQNHKYPKTQVSNPPLRENIFNKWSSTGIQIQIRLCPIVIFWQLRERPAIH